MASDPTCVNNLYPGSQAACKASISAHDWDLSSAMGHARTQSSECGVSGTFQPLAPPPPWATGLAMSSRPQLRMTRVI